MTVFRSLDNDDDFLTLLKLPNFNLEWEQQSKAELLDTQTSLKSFKVKISVKTFSVSKSKESVKSNLVKDY